MTKSLIFGLVCGLGVVGILAGGSYGPTQQEEVVSTTEALEIPAQLEPMTIVAPTELMENAPVDLGVMEVRFDATMAETDTELAQNAQTQ
ncbi:MAG: hypothetical protein QNJ40_26995 [Xanthomonadales bacterium]|nr:hypothetical protein [Xanthomonadales bacterium]